MNNFQSADADTERQLVKKHKTAKERKKHVDVKIRKVNQPQILIPKTRSINKELQVVDNTPELLT